MVRCSAIPNAIMSQWRRLKGIDHRLDRIEEVKMKMDWKMEEPVLVAKIRESSVLLSKDSSKWNWDIVGELIDGPLRYPAHLATACKTKFFKRILYFLRPNSYLFSVFPYSDVRGEQPATETAAHLRPPP